MTTEESTAATPVAIDALTPEQQEIYYNSFLVRYKRAIEHWMRTHPNSKLPVVLDAAGKPRWVNRAERRAAEKRRKNKIKIYVHNYK